MSPGLKTGVTRAIFIFSGKFQLLWDKSKMHFNGTNNESKFVMNAVNEKYRNGQVKEIFLFCTPSRTSGWNMFYLRLLIGLLSSKK